MIKYTIFSIILNSISWYILVDKDALQYFQICSNYLIKYKSTH